MSAGYAGLDTNLLPSQVQIGRAKPIKKIGQSLFEGPAFFMIGSGGAFAKIVDLYAEPFPLVSNGF